jgi:hypothetical protein
MSSPKGHARIEYVMSRARKNRSSLKLARDGTSYTGYKIVYGESEFPASVFEVILWERLKECERERKS